MIKRLENFWCKKMYIHEKKKYEIWGYVITLWTNKTYVIKKRIQEL